LNKTDLDIRRERIAHGLSDRLVGTHVSVAGGGHKSGPYAVVVTRLSRKELDLVLAGVLAVTGGTMRPEGGAK
jgi:hypothetical protein